MPRFLIDSLWDPRLEPHRSLKRTNLTRWSGQFIAEGEKLFRRLLESDYPVASVLLSQRYVDSHAPLVSDDVPLFIVPDSMIETLVGFNFHRGILACGRRKPDVPLDAVAGRSGPLTMIVLPDVQDPENLGAILRIGGAFGIDAVLLGRRCADPLSRRVLRVSMGAALRVPLVRCDEIAAAMNRLRREHRVSLAATLLDPTAEPIGRFVRPNRFALVFGSEGHGLEPAIIELCDRRITIPIEPGTDSLNVAVAAGIFLHHFQRRC